MSLIFSISIENTQPKAIGSMTQSDGSMIGSIIKLSISPVENVSGPELQIISSNQFVLPIPKAWADLREKELAALRRTIANATIDIGRKVKPAIIYASDVDLSGLAASIMSRTLNCPLVLGLCPNDIEEGLFNERKLAILDSCIGTADAIICIGESETKLLRNYYPALSARIMTAEGLSVDIPEVHKLLKDLTRDRQSIPWRRHRTKPLLVSKPLLTGNEKVYVDEVLNSGWWGYGPVAKYLEEQFIESCGCDGYALAVSSCTAALHLSLIAAGVGPGDEVIVPALTFISTALAVVHSGATPIFADVDPLTLGIMSLDVERKLSKRTKAVIPVHFAGIPIDIKSLSDVLQGRSLIIEDAAHAMGARINDLSVGSLSPFTCFSFAPTKQVPSCGGGILVYKAASLTSKLRELSDVGLSIDTHSRTARSGAAPANEIVSIGYRYRMNDITAAIAVAQLQQLRGLMEARSSLIKRYYNNLAEMPLCELISVPNSIEPSWYIMPIRVPVLIRDSLRNFLASKGIDTSIHYPSLTEQPIFKHMQVSTPSAQQESKRLISLPLHLGMTGSDVDRVCSLVCDFLLKNCVRD